MFDYEKRRNELLRSQSPYMILNKEELMAEGKNLYRLGDDTVFMSPSAQRQLDQLIGLSAVQRKGLEETYGDEAVVNIRNSLAMASCVAKPKRFALIANAEECVVDGVMPLEDEAIPMETFFSLIEMFADKHAYEVENVSSSGNGTYGLTARLLPHHPVYDNFFNNDEFLANAIYIKWNLGGVEMGNYIKRMICTNGSFEVSEHALGMFHRIDDKRMAEFMNLSDKSSLCRRNLGFIKRAAEEARDTAASLSEMQKAKRLLTRSGTPDDLAERLLPYNELLDAYKQAGLQHADATRCKTNVSMWDVFNRLTDFASHTPLWSEDDNRRTELMQQSMVLLQTKRDIKTYHDIFSA